MSSNNETGPTAEPESARAPSPSGEPRQQEKWVPTTEQNMEHFRGLLQFIPDNPYWVRAYLDMLELQTYREAMNELVEEFHAAVDKDALNHTQIGSEAHRSKYCPHLTQLIKEWTVANS